MEAQPGPLANELKPWRYNEAGYTVYCADGDTVVCKVGPLDQEHVGPMLAAAPELAEACKQICRYHDKILKDHGHIVTTDPWAYDLKDALWACSEKARAALANLK